MLTNQKISTTFAAAPLSRKTKTKITRSNKKVKIIKSPKSVKSTLTTKPVINNKLKTLTSQTLKKPNIAHAHCKKRLARRQVLATLGHVFKSGGAPGKKHTYKRTEESKKGC